MAEPSKPTSCPNCGRMGDQDPVRKVEGVRPDGRAEGWYCPSCDHRLGDA